MFRNFDINKEHDKRRNYDEPVQPHNMIIYAGNNHSNCYRRFLEVLGFKEIETTINPNKKGYCIDMKTIKQPFFSEWPKKFNWYENIKDDTFKQHTFKISTHDKLETIEPEESKETFPKIIKMEKEQDKSSDKEESSSDKQD